MIKAKLQSKRNSLEKVLKRKIEELENQEVEVGHFASQGMHYSGYSYPDLMALQASGGDGDWPARPVLAVVNFQLSRETKTDSFRKYLNNWSKDIQKKDATLKLLEDIGLHVAKFEQSFFGSPSADIPSNSPYTIRLKGADTPLVDTGDLQAKVAHKNTLTNNVQEAGR